MDDFKEIGNYTILRKIGEGAFGKVFLVENKKQKKFYALKIIDNTLKDREIDAFKKFKNLIKNNNIIEILDSGFIRDNFYYLMPLADSLDSDSNFPPSDFRWQEKSLYKEIVRRIDTPTLPYFSVSEILQITSSIFDAVISLNENALLHRDIKPENILFINNTATLSDFGLLDFDSKSISRVGTPLYFAPSWYINKGGNPDVYGLAMTFYTLITGNLPDTIGRVAYRFPEKLKLNINKDLEAQYLHWHRVILRAIAENPTHRYLQIKDFKEAILSKDFESSLIYNTKALPSEKASKKLKNFIAICLIFAVVLFIFYLRHNPTPMQSINETKVEDINNTIYKEIAKNGYKESTYRILSKQEWVENQEKLLAELIDNYKQNKAENANIGGGFLPKETAEAFALSRENSYKEAIFIMQERLKDDNFYDNYIKNEYIRIQELIKKERTLNDL